MARLSSREILWNQISRTSFQDRVMPYAYWVRAINDSDHHWIGQFLFFLVQISLDCWAMSTLEMFGKTFVMM